MSRLPKVYVVAPPAVAQLWAEDHGLPRRAVVVVTRAEQLRGLSWVLLVWLAGPDFPQLTAVTDAVRWLRAWGTVVEPTGRQVAMVAEAWREAS